MCVCSYVCPEEPHAGSGRCGIPPSQPRLMKVHYETYLYGSGQANRMLVAYAELKVKITQGVAFSTPSPPPPPPYISEIRILEILFFIIA